MAEELQRRVYTLPVDTVERIERYRVRAKASSEVEVVRALLAEALDRYDDADALAARVVGHLRRSGSLAASAKELVVDHPLVWKVMLDPNALTFWLDPSSSVTVRADGTVEKGTKPDTPDK